MLTSEQEERLEIVRRAAERGKALCEPAGYDSGHSAALDVFIHILDEIARINYSIRRDKAKNA